MKNLFVLFLASLATACATQAPERAQEASAARCWKEFPTGSNLPVTRCRSQDEMDRDREESREVMEQLARPPGRTIGSSGP